MTVSRGTIRRRTQVTLRLHPPGVPKIVLSKLLNPCLPKPMSSKTHVFSNPCLPKHMSCQTDVLPNRCLAKPMSLPNPCLAKPMSCQTHVFQNPCLCQTHVLPNPYLAKTIMCQNYYLPNACLPKPRKKQQTQMPTTICMLPTTNTHTLYW